MTILNDRNYKKYAIRNPKNITQINVIDSWARERTMKKLKMMKKIIILALVLHFFPLLQILR